MHARRRITPTLAIAARRLTSSLALMFGLAIPSLVAAQSPGAPPNARSEAEAKQEFKAGKAAFEARNYLLALEHFKRAEARVPGPAPSFMLGQTYEGLGRPAEAVEAYRAFLAYSPDPASNYGKRIPEAKARIAALEPTVPATVRVAVTPPGAQSVLVVDGVPGQRSPLSLTPGRHTLVITSPGYQSYTETLLLAGRETRDVVVQLAPEVAKVAPLAFTEPLRSERRVGVPAIICFGVAGVGAVVGGIFGGLALQERSRFYEHPSTEAADATERNALLSDVSLGVGVVAAATGTVLLFVGGRPSDRVGHAAPRVSPWFGPSGAGVAAAATF